MTSARRTSTQLSWLLAALLAPAGASAQLGRALDSPTASAGVAAAPSGWALDLSAQTSLPLSIGLEAQLTTPPGFFAAVAVGHTPNAYLGMLTGILEGAGAYGDSLRPMIGETIANGAWNVRVGVGWRVVEGLELSVGYTYLGANTTLSREAIEAATGQRMRYRGLREAPFALELHALHARVGYRFVIEEHFVLAVALGWTHGVGASARLDVPAEVRAIDGNPASTIEDAVAEGFTQYGFTPELLLSAGYRF